ncbi:MAG TPA: hypothetical protein VIL48_23530 [Acidimicrobiales bacterium]
MQATHLDTGTEPPGLAPGIGSRRDDEVRGVGQLQATAAEPFGSRVAG